MPLKCFLELKKKKKKKVEWSERVDFSTDVDLELKTRLEELPLLKASVSILSVPKRTRLEKSRKVNKGEIRSKL